MTRRPEQPDAASALATRRENGGVAKSDLANEIRKMQNQFQLAMPRGGEAAQLIRDALTALRGNPKLGQCEPLSVLGGLMTCAQLGLRPGVLGHAWLLPFWDSKERGHKAQLVIGYQGMVELAYRSGRVLSIAARTVYTNDRWELEYRQDGDYMRHVPNFDGERGDARLYYARAQIADGGYALTDPMTHADMLRYRDKNAKARNRNGEVFGPWIDEFEGMSHKTMIRRLSKLLPKSTELAIALQADEGIRIDLTPTADAAEVTEQPVVIDGDAEAQDEPTSANDVPPPVEDWPNVSTSPGVGDES